MPIEYSNPGFIMKTRILIADCLDMFREVLRRLLEMQPDFAVAADTGDGQSLPVLVSEHTPDVLLLGLKLRRRCGRLRPPIPVCGPSC